MDEIDKIESWLGTECERVHLYNYGGAYRAGAFYKDRYITGQGPRLTAAIADLETQLAKAKKEWR